MIVLGVSMGLAAGLGGYTFIYAKGGSYLTNDPVTAENKTSRKRTIKLVVVTAFVAALAAIGAAALLVNIMERKQEATRILGESINFSRKGQVSLKQ